MAPSTPDPPAADLTLEEGVRYEVVEDLYGDDDRWTEPESNQFLTSTRTAFRNANTIRVRGRPLGPIWFTHIADAIELARPQPTHAHQITPQLQMGWGWVVSD